MIMNTNEIDQILRRDKRVGGIFIGVFASDRLPTRVPRPAALVVNLDPAHKPGIHWI